MLVQMVVPTVTQCSETLLGCYGELCPGEEGVGQLFRDFHERQLLLLLGHGVRTGEHVLGVTHAALAGLVLLGELRVVLKVLDASVLSEK